MASAANIPLKCDICPKKPRFSDVSHLLTHISSKTHLSNIFKARVRLETDTECRRLVEDYDQWYAEWSIQDLLAERLSQKDSKMAKPRTRQPAKMVGGRRQPAGRTASIAGNQPGIGGPLPAAGSMPFRYGQGVQGGGLFSLGPTGAGFQPVAGGQSMMRVDPNLSAPPIFNGSPTPYLPRPDMLPSYPHPRHDNSQSFGRHMSQAPPAFAQSLQQQHEVETVLGKRKAAIMADSRMKSIAQRELSVQTTGTQTGTQVTTPFESDGWSVVSLDTPDGSYIYPPNELNDLPNCVPKGLVLQGMGCFDAATPAQKAKRNQKKPEAAYQLLEEVSIDIKDNGGYESTQLILEGDPQWQPVRAKLITGHPTASSLATSSPPPSPRAIAAPPPARNTRLSALRTRAARAGPSTTRDHRTNAALMNNVVPRERINVYAGEDDRVSVDTFVQNRTSRHARPPKRGKFTMNQENSYADNLSAHATVKTDDDGTEADSFTLPSIERPIFQPQYPANTPTFGSSLGQTSMFPPATMQPHPYTASPTRPMTGFGMNGYGMTGYGMNGYGMNGFGNASSPARGMPAYIGAHNNGQVLSSYDEGINFYTGPGGPMPATRTFPQPHQSSSPTRIGYTSYAPASRPQPAMPANAMTFGFPTPSAATFTFPPPTQTFSPALNTGLSPIISTGLSPMLNGGLHNSLGADMNTTTGLDNLAQAATQDADGAGILASGGIEDEDRTVTAPGSGDGPTGA